MKKKRERERERSSGGEGPPYPRDGHSRGELVETELECALRSVQAKEGDDRAKLQIVPWPLFFFRFNLESCSNSLFYVVKQIQKNMNLISLESLSNFQASHTIGSVF